MLHADLAALHVLEPTDLGPAGGGDEKVTATHVRPGHARRTPSLGRCPGLDDRAHDGVAARAPCVPRVHDPVHLKPDAEAFGQDLGELQLEARLRLRLRREGSASGCAHTVSVPLSRMAESVAPPAPAVAIASAPATTMKTRIAWCLSLDSFSPWNAGAT